MSEDAVKAGQIWERKRDGKRVRVIEPEMVWLGKMLYLVVNTEGAKRPRRTNLAQYRRVETP